MERERRPHANFSALPAVKGEAEEHWGQGSGAWEIPAPTTPQGTPCCSLSPWAPVDETLAAATSLSHASFSVQGTWAFSPVCWLEPRSVLERFCPQWIFQNPALYPNSSLESCSSQTGKAPREHRTHNQAQPPTSLSFPTQRNKIHTHSASQNPLEPTSALNCGVMHILIHFLSFILNLLITFVKENTQP